MRRINAVLSALILVLFLLHAVMGSFLMTGVTDDALKAIAWLDAGLILLHAAIGVKLTIESVRAGRVSGAWYLKENLLFWARRLSGFAIFIFLFFHLTAFSTDVAGNLRLSRFGAAKLFVNLALVLSIAVHVIANVRPMLISFGIPKLKARAGEMLFVLSVLLLFMAAAFVIYYLRWNVW